LAEANLSEKRAVSIFSVEVMSFDSKQPTKKLTEGWVRRRRGTSSVLGLTIPAFETNCWKWQTGP
jgi:hypothetical protein